jgi:hypothetical protein
LYIDICLYLERKRPPSSKGERESDRKQREGAKKEIERGMQRKRERDCERAAVLLVHAVYECAYKHK